jgi:hypothetical protein
MEELACLTTALKALLSETVTILISFESSGRQEKFKLNKAVKFQIC